jgi:flagellar protein FliS
MTNTARAVAAYQEMQVASRSPLELVVMLYDGALDAIRHAAAAMRRGDAVAKKESMSKGLEILQHLQSTLNMEAGGAIAANLDQLYAWAAARVVEANVSCNADLLDEVVALLTPIRDAWATLATSAGQEPSTCPVSASR